MDRVPVQSRTYKAGEVEKDEIANISNEREESAGQSVKRAEEEYAHLFTVLEERKTLPALVPLHASWFSLDKINEIEIRAMKIEKEEEKERYVEIRNSIFRLFHQQPNMHLTITQCRKSLPIDVAEIIKIHTFLEHWGLINYKIGVKRDISAMLEKINQRDLFNMQKGTACADNNTVIQRESFPKIVTVGEPATPAPVIVPSMQNPPIDPLRDISKQHTLQAGAPRITHIPVEVWCTECGVKMNAMKNEDKIYFSDRERIILCRVCFDAGKYPSAFSYSNFHLLEAGVIRQVWTPEEEMLLVEGIEMYKDNWKSVAAYVKTKTVEQCVLHFLKMGIQDPLLEMEAFSFPETSIPFNYSLNPVMTTVAFLASVVHPGVACSAAKAAAKEIHRLSQEREKDSNEAAWLNGRLNEIAAVALSSCIARAEQQRELEEGKKERLLEVLVESEMKRIELKVSEFSELSKSLRKEREDLEKMRETYRKAHIETRKEIAEIVSRVRQICTETGKNFEEIFFKDKQQQ